MAEQRDEGPTAPGHEDVLEVRVGDDEGGARVDAWLPRALPGVSRARARSLAEEGRVRLGGRALRKGDRVPAGARVEVRESPCAREELRAIPADDPRVETLVAEDGLVVLDKPAGMPAVPIRPGETGTVANVLAHRYPGALMFDPVEGGLLQRLDRETSGLCAAAVTEDAYELLLALRREVGFEKGYLALVAGSPEEGRLLDGAIVPARGDRRRVEVLPRDAGEASGARPAETFVDEVEPVPGGLSLVVVRTRTGRRHQVRAHLAAAGHPLAGDHLYGGPDVPGLPRHFLHAHELAVPHPQGDRILRVGSPLPADLRRVVEGLFPT